MKRRKGTSLCTCAVAFALGALLAFIMPVWFIAAMEAVIILIFGYILFFGC
ncbi:MAG: hypothetical protein IJD97_03230 [Clostridia bacterium]|nr:hypothetical protein [Clostridia bacterium]